MAIKEKETAKQNKLIQILTTDYRWENLLLGIVATIAAALAVIIISGNGPLVINPDFPVLGNRVTQLIFAWLLLAVSLVGLGLVVAPFFQPSIPELKKITWGTKKQFLDHSVRVIIFFLLLAIIIFLYDLLSTTIVDFLKGISKR